MTQRPYQILFSSIPHKHIVQGGDTVNVTDLASILLTATVEFIKTRPWILSDNLRVMFLFIALRSLLSRLFTFCHNYSCLNFANLKKTAIDLINDWEESTCGEWFLKFNCASVGPSRLVSTPPGGLQCGSTGQPHCSHRHRDRANNLSARGGSAVDDRSSSFSLVPISAARCKYL